MEQTYSLCQQKNYKNILNTNFSTTIEDRDGFRAGVCWSHTALLSLWVTDTSHRTALWATVWAPGWVPEGPGI